MGTNRNYHTERKEMRARVYARFDDRCGYCGNELDSLRTDGKDGRRCIDHVTPKCADGCETEENLMPACWNCNSIKNGRPLEFLRRYRGLQKIGYSDIVTLSQYERLRAAGAGLPPIPYVEFHFESCAIEL